MFIHLRPIEEEGGGVVNYYLNFNLPNNNIPIKFLISFLCRLVTLKKKTIFSAFSLVRHHRYGLPVTVTNPDVSLRPVFYFVET